MSQIPFSKEYIRKTIREHNLVVPEVAPGATKATPVEETPEFLAVAKADIAAALSSSFPFVALLDIIAESAVFSPIEKSQELSPLIEATKKLFPVKKVADAVDKPAGTAAETGPVYHVTAKAAYATPEKAESVFNTEYFPNKDWLPRENNASFGSEVISAAGDFPQTWNHHRVFGVSNTLSFSPEYAFIYDVSRHLNKYNCRLTSVYYNIASKVEERGVHKHMMNLFIILGLGDGHHHDPALDEVKLPLVSSCDNKLLSLAARHFSILIDAPTSNFRHCLDREHVRVTAGDRLDLGIEGTTAHENIRKIHCALSECFKLAIKESVTTNIVTRRRFSNILRTGYADIKPAVLVSIEEDVKGFLTLDDEFKSDLLFAPLEFPNILPGNKLTESFFSEISKLGKEELLNLANFFLLNTFNLIDETEVAATVEEEVPFNYKRLPLDTPKRPVNPQYGALNSLNESVLATSIEFYRLFCDYTSVKEVPGIRKIEEFEDLFYHIVRENYPDEFGEQILHTWETLPKETIEIGGTNLNKCKYIFRHASQAEAIVKLVKGSK